MAERCPYTPQCPLFPLFVLESTSELWRERYCERDFESCRRYQLKKSGQPVEPTMLPNGNRLTRIASGKGKP